MSGLISIAIVLVTLYFLAKVLWRAPKWLWARRGALGARWKLSQLLSERSGEIKAAEREVARWESGTGGPLTKLENVWLHERALRIGSEIIPLRNVRAEAVSSGEVHVESRPTVTRAALGGCLFGWWGALFSMFIPKQQTRDSRRPMLRLWVEDRERVIFFKPYHDQVVFELAAMINNQALEAPDLERHRDQFVRESKMELMKARADTPEIAALRAKIAAKKRGKMDPGGTDGPRIAGS